MNVHCTLMKNGWMRLNIAAKDPFDFKSVLFALKKELAVMVYVPQGRKYKTSPYEFKRLVKTCKDKGYELSVTPKLSRYMKRFNRLKKIRNRAEIDLPLAYWTDDKELQPLDYQITAIKKALIHKRFLIADDMGLGKTIQAIGLITESYAINGHTKFLIVVPNRLRMQWKNEILRFTKFKDDDVTILDEDEWVCHTGEKNTFGRKNNVCVGCRYYNDCNYLKSETTEARRRRQIKEAFILITNYEKLNPYRDIIINSKYKVIIMDEASRLKNPSTLMTRAANNIIKKMEMDSIVVPMTGTPIENRLEELYSLITLVDNRIFGSVHCFNARYLITDYYGKVVAYNNKKEFKAKVMPKIIRRTIDEVWKQRPPLVNSIESCEFSPYQKKIYEDAREGVLSAIADLEKARKINMMNLAPLIATLLTVCGTVKSIDPNTTNKGHSCKINVLKEMLLNDIEEHEKVVVFSKFSNKVMPYILEELLMMRIGRILCVKGGVKDSDEVIQEFKNNTKCRVLLASDAFSYGKNIQFANRVVNFDLPWNPAVLEQRIRRVYRRGQEKTVYVTNLLVPGTFEERVYETIVRKQRLFQEFFKVGGGLGEMRRPNASNLVRMI